MNKIIDWINNSNFLAEYIWVPYLFIMILGLIWLIVMIIRMIKHTKKSKAFRKIIKIGDECSFSSPSGGKSGTIIEIQEKSVIMEIKVPKHLVYPINKKKNDTKK